jgi:putative ABC transport system substrate-binding protein
MRRREFVTLVGGTAAWPLAAHAQQADRTRRIGVLMALAADDPQVPVRVAAFAQGLQQRGWTDGHNLRIDYRWAGGDPDLTRRYASELVALGADVILCSGASTMGPLQHATRTVPIVFTNVADPVSAGFIETLAKPGGNATGFMSFEYGMSSKWLELLREIAPRVVRVAVLRNPANPAVGGQLGAIQAAAAPLSIELSPVGMRDADEIERVLAAFARSANGGLIVTGSPLLVSLRELIIALAARHRLPAVYPNRFFVIGGGLISYAPEPIDQFRRAAGYVDRILKGEKPADLPVQAPVKYELVLNLKTAKALGLELPATVLARADEVIE